MTTRASIPDLPFGFAPCLLDREVAKAICHKQKTLRYLMGPLSTPTALLSLGLWDIYEGPTRLLNPHRWGNMALCPQNSAQQAGLILE